MLRDIGINMQRKYWNEGKKNRKPKVVDVDDVIKEVESKLMTEDEVQQNNFEHRLKWAMEDE